MHSKRSKGLFLPFGPYRSKLCIGCGTLPEPAEEIFCPASYPGCTDRISRLYIGIHYPTDVLVGLIDGIFLGIMGALLGNYIYKKFEEKKAVPED